MSQRFHNKAVFITGASAGIGLETARAFAREGAQLAIAARRLDRLESLKSDLEAMGAKVLALECDVTNRASLDQAVAKTLEAFGRIDVVLANAGFGVSGIITDLETDDFRRQFDTNVFGLMDTVYATLPHLIESKGRLGLIGSVSGRVGTPASAPYTASKFAVVGFGECIYYDLAEKGVSVTLINPGFVSSEIRSINNKGELTDHPDPIPQWLVMPAETAAKHIVSALYKRKPELVVTLHGKIGVFINRHFPRTWRFILRMGSQGRLANTRKAKQGKQ